MGDKQEFGRGVKERPEKTPTRSGWAGQCQESSMMRNVLSYKEIDRGWGCWIRDMGSVVPTIFG